jgi:hypothetical protein
MIIVKLEKVNGYIEKYPLYMCRSKHKPLLYINCEFVIMCYECALPDNWDLGLLYSLQEEKLVFYGKNL